MAQFSTKVRDKVLGSDYGPTTASGEDYVLPVSGKTEERTIISLLSREFNDDIAVWIFLRHGRENFLGGDGQEEFRWILPWQVSRVSVDFGEPVFSGPIWSGKVDARGHGSSPVRFLRVLTTRIFRNLILTFIVLFSVAERAKSASIFLKNVVSSMMHRAYA